LSFPAPLLPVDQPAEVFRLLVESVQDYAIFMLDPQGRVASWNEGARRIKGYEADEIVGRSFELFYAPDAVRRGWPQEELRRAAANGRFEDEGWRVRKDGSRFWASVVLTALHERDGRLLGFAKVTRDLSERRANEEALRRSEEQLRLMVEAVQDYAIFMLDVDGTVLSWNAAAQALTGYEASEAIGRNHADFFTAVDQAAGKPAVEIAAARDTGRAESQGWWMRKNGSAFWTSMVMTTVLDLQGGLRGFVVVTRDLSEQRRLLELEQATRRTHEFLAVLAHELRNPLAPIRNAVSIMQLHPQMPAALGGARDIIDRQLTQLTRLVDDLLDVARISTGKIALQLARTDMRELVNASLESVKSQAAARRQQIEASLPEHPIWVNGDSPRLIQALHNVLHNAVKFTPAGGHIRLVLDTEGRNCTISVADTGRGIAPEALERIFQMFVQEDDGRRSPAESGLGIGLNLARSLVEKHGGCLTAESPGIDQGSTFTMMLPLMDAVDAAPQAAPTAGRDGHVLRVLVVDDNRDSADTMARLLDLLGHRVLTAYGAAEAASLAPAFDPDIVFLDINLPDGSGYSVLEQLRASLPRQPLYAAMTGYGQDNDRANTQRAGFEIHLVKPLSFEQVRGALELARQRMAPA
jgi:PAS domain S-box-containing protein